MNFNYWKPLSKPSENFLIISHYLEILVQLHIENKALFCSEE